MFKFENPLEPIMAKEWQLKNWNNYGLGLENEQEMLELLNICQAAGTTLENVVEDWKNGEVFVFGHIYAPGQRTIPEIVESIRAFYTFYTDEEFIDYILDQMVELKEEGYDDPAAEIHSWTYEGEMTDTVVHKTEDGYVIQVSY